MMKTRCFVIIWGLFFCGLPMLAAAEQIFLGGDEAIIVSDGSTKTALPLDVTIAEISLVSTRDRGDAAASLQIKLTWSSMDFHNDLAQENLIRRDQGRHALEPNGPTLCTVTVEMLGPGGKPVRLSRIVAISIGNEQDVEFLIDASVADEARKIALGSQGLWTPGVYIDLQWKALSVPTKIIKPKAGLLLKKANGNVSSVSVRFPSGLGVPPDIQLAFWSAGEKQVRSLNQGMTDLGMLPAESIGYTVFQNLRHKLFRNTVYGKIATFRDGSPVTEILPVDTTQIIVSTETLRGLYTRDTYLLFMFRDRSMQLRVSYIPLVSRDRTITAEILREEGVPFFDGILFGFDSSSKLSSAQTVSSNSFDQPDVFLDIGEAETGAAAADMAREFFQSCVKGRVRAVIGGMAPTSSNLWLANLEKLVDAELQKFTAAIQPQSSFQHFSSAIDFVNQVTDSWLEEQFPGSRLGVQLEFITSADTVAEELRRASSIVVRQDDEGEMARQALIDYFERLPDGQNADLVHLLLSQASPTMEIALKRRFWARARTLTVPRDSSFAEAFELLKSGRKVGFDDGTAIRNLTLRSDVLSLDLSGLSNGSALAQIMETGATGLRVNLGQANVPADSFASLSSRRSRLLDIDLNGAILDGRALKYLLDQPNAQVLRLALSDVAAEAISSDIETHFHNLRQLDIDISDAKGVLKYSFPKFVAPRLERLRLNLSGINWADNTKFETVSQLKNLKYLNVNLSRPVGRGIELGASLNLFERHPRLKTLVLSLPRLAGPYWLSTNAERAQLDELVLSLDAGADADLFFSKMPKINAKRTTLILSETIISSSALNVLQERLVTDKLEIDLRGSRLEQRPIQDFFEWARSNGSVKLIAPDGTEFKG